MRYVVISGSRADIAPLIAVAEALKSPLLHVPRVDVGNPAEAAQQLARAANWTTNRFIKEHEPDMAIVLGDRFEILGVASALNLMGIPIAHLSGGDVTEGSLDDGMRHAITKLAHIHFPTNMKSANRILRMGEEPWRVFTVGCPGVDQLLKIQPYTKEETLKKLAISDPYVLVNYQIPTLCHDPLAEAQALLDGLYALRKPIAFTTLNPEAFSLHVQEMFTNYCRNTGSVIMDMPQRLYISAMKYCDVMIGNSSSGFYEAPTLKVPFLNVGNRQSGRTEALNVLSVPCAPGAIINGVTELKKIDLSQTVNPYGNGHAAEHIRDSLKIVAVMTRAKLLRKKWVHYDFQPDMGNSTLGPAMGELSE